MKIDFWCKVAECKAHARVAKMGSPNLFQVRDVSGRRAGFAKLAH